MKVNLIKRECEKETLNSQKKENEEMLLIHAFMSLDKELLERVWRRSLGFWNPSYQADSKIGTRHPSLDLRVESHRFHRLYSME